MNLFLIEPDEPPGRGFAPRRPGLPCRPARSAQRPKPHIRPYWSAERGNEWLDQHITRRQQGVALLFVAAFINAAAKLTNFDETVGPSVEVHGSNLRK